MPRSISAASILALENASYIILGWMVEIELSGTTLRLWSGIGPIIWNGQTWLGNGWFLDFTPVRETTDASAQGFTIRLTSVPSEVIALISNQTQQNRIGTVYQVLLDDNENVVLDPFELCSGEVDAVEYIEGTEDTATVAISFESDFLLMQQSKETRMTDAYQKSKYPSDKGFEHVALIQNKQLYWGGVANIPKAQRY